MADNKFPHSNPVAKPITQPQLPPGSVSLRSTTEPSAKVFRDKALSSRGACSKSRETLRVVEFSGALGEEAERMNAPHRAAGVVILDPRGADLQDLTPIHVAAKGSDGADPKGASR